MDLRDEIDQLRRRLERLTAELEDARVRLAALESRVPSAADLLMPSVPPAPPQPIPELPPEPPPLPTVPLMATPEQAPIPVLAAAPIHELPADAPPIQMVFRPPSIAPAEEEPAPPPWKRWLQSMQLWPPDDEGDAEVRLGAWWATRLGAMFAVIGVVFFGVYLSLETAPWVKLAELALVAAATIAGGWWLEQRWPRFGQVIFASGQALAFFAAFAAYTVPAVKVLDSRLAAVSWQLAVAAAIAVSAWRRRAVVEATMAVVLGFVAAWFSLAGGFQLFALTAAGTLAVVAVVWRRWLDWAAPSLIALLGYWAIYGTIVGGLSFATTPLLPDWVWCFVLGGYALFFWRDDPWGAKHVPSPAETQWAQNINSSAALAAGWCTAWFAFPDHLDWFYTWAAVVLALASWRRRAIDHGGPIAALLLAKASGALTLAVISWTDGRTTDLALLVQAGVMLAANRRLHSRVLGLAAGLVWGVSLAFWIDRVDDERLVWGTIRTMMTIAYGVGATIWLLEAARALRAAHAELAQLARQLAAVVGGGLAIVAALWILPAAWLPSRFVVAALILMLIGRLWGSVAVLGAGGVVLLAAHLAYWFRLAPATELEAWINLGAVLPPTLVVAILLGRRVDAEESDRRTAVVAWTISAWAIVTSIGAAWKLLDDISALAVGGLLAAGLALSAPRRPRRGWMWLMAWTVAVGTTAFALSKLSDRPVFAAAVAIALWFGIATLQAWPVGAAQLARESRREWPQRIVVWLGWMIALVAIVQCADVVQPAAAGGLALVAVALLTWSWVGGLRFAAWALWSLAGVVVFFDQPLPLTREIILLVGSAWAPVLTWGWWSEWLEDREERGRPAETTLIVQSWLAALLAIVVVQATSSGAAQVFAFAGVAALIAVLNRLRLPRLLPVARVMALVAWLAAAVAVINGATHEWSRVTQAVFTTAALLVVLPFVLRWPERESDRWTWLQAGLGLALAFIVALAQTGQLEPYTTVAWGAVALVCFVAGVLGRSKPHRLLGLLGVLFCIPRVFLVDLQSTLYRIVAFAVLGLVLLWVGFSYHRFRRWITDTEDEATAGKD